MWTLAGTGDPDLALNAAHRFMQASGAQWPTVRECLINEPVVRTRFLALLGGSTALADHSLPTHSFGRSYEVRYLMRVKHCE